MDKDLKEGSSMNQLEVRAIRRIINRVQCTGGGGGNSHMKGAGMLVGNFELNP